MQINRRKAVTQRRGTRAFTLVEVLIVVIILGILASIVIPRFVSATDESRENALKMNLYRIRTQLQLYHTQHNDNWPTLAAFEDEMTLSSNASGTTAAVGTPGFPFGPYLRALPNNPETGASTVGNGAVGSSDWYYDETVGGFYANDTAESRAF